MAQIRSEVVVALGSNMQSTVGDPHVTLRQAIQAMGVAGLLIRGESRFFSTPCFPAGAGPDYVNAVVVAATTLPPAQVLAALHAIEHEFGRERVQRWGQRTLDLDLIAYGDVVAPDAATFDHWRTLAIEDQKLKAPQDMILPHPRVQDRAFVLVPMCDVAPDWRHPVLGRTARQMLDALPEELRAEVVPLP